MPRKPTPPSTAVPLTDTDGVLHDAPDRPTDAQDFQDAYQRLQDAVQTVRAASVDDLDTLVACVQQGAAAHKVCKARIQAVRALLDGLNVDTPGSTV